jgi:integrase
VISSISCLHLLWRTVKLTQNLRNTARKHPGYGIRHSSHTYRSRLDAVGTPVAVQQKMMRHADIRTTFNIYGDVVTDEMTTASGKVAQLAFQMNGAQTERKEG